MAVTVGQSAISAVLAAFFSTLNVASVKTGLGYAVGVYGGPVPQTATKPYLRIRSVSEIQNSTYGRNGKDLVIAVDVFDDYGGELRVAAIMSRVLALLNPAGNYHALVVAGYIVIHVDYEQGLDAGTEEIVGVIAQHKVLLFRVTVEEV